MDDQSRVCPGCGFPSARLKRQDHYISLFFIPLIPVKRGEKFLECGHCGRVFDEAGRPHSSAFEERSVQICPGCGEEITRTFKFCPHCGERVS